MKKSQMALLSLLVVMPVTAMAQKAEMNMTHDMPDSPASKEYMAGMQKMHHNMMAAMKEQDPDRAFASGMAEHHKGAIAMAETELKYGKDPEMRKMAQEIIKAQKGEIEQLEKWLQK
ncbi:DUF305 domain-containing protein [Pantoea sp. M_8]|jgi:uncharacterized protein (DUF305 family)|uniref:DUF305 domain-containing protein n=2 Tax=Erwiniaceae TaxID=1903409 RepID=A0ABY2Z9D1_9GAMM|nr:MULTISPECIES: DUF305 domain-containing protein [Pantoea]KAA5974304.1 DUF305 domain-containing protein [Pantoea sp. M_6]KAA5978432.1 DUF305 domain-containing protein [Pantoea sp. M_8]KAA5989810.1 DUF305 domain-containing protein [Pantoea sp. M_10]KAA6002961.1 DUF305 domain-containing protein [Pantoea sp. M_5]KKB02949.1 hypothetical protein TN98_18245 [Pantoea anthophila]